MSGRDDRRAEAGFSLVEVLVALAIAAIATVVLMRGASQSLNSVSAIDMRMGARMLVKSLIEDELSAATAAPEQREGDSGPYRWTLSIEDAGAPAGTVLPQGYQMYRLTASAYWGQGGRMTVSALKLGR